MSVGTRNRFTQIANRAVFLFCSGTEVCIRRTCAGKTDMEDELLPCGRPPLSSSII